MPCSWRRNRRDAGRPAVPGCAVPYGVAVSDHDLVVIGGGAAGLGAARAGVRAGARVLLVSAGEPGGDCTFTGCVPSKTLIEAAARSLPFPVAAQRVRDAVLAIAATEDAATLRAEGIDVTLGRAQFTRPDQIEVDGRPVHAGRFVVATGAAPLIPPIPGLAGVAYLTNETVFDLSELPPSLAVLGGGATGCELAQAFARLGSHVTVIEGTDRLLSNEEPDAARVIAEVFAREGVDVRLGARLEHAGADDGGGVRLWLGDGTEVRAAGLLVAVGRRPVTADLDLPAAGIAVDDRGHIRTDEHLATTTRGVYAAGDVTGRMPFTHAAFEMGRIAAGNALSRRRSRYRPAATSWLTFTDPELPRFGPT